MNNSYDRILTGLTETLRGVVLPELKGEFVRGQVFGVIYMLNFLRLRGAWAAAYLDPQLTALDELAAELGTLQGLPADAPRPVSAAHPGDAEASQALRDEGDAQVAALIDWPGMALLDSATRAAAEAAIKRYINRQLRHELQTSARPMFAEISTGEEQTGSGGENAC